MKVVPDIVLREHQKGQHLVALMREDLDDNDLHGFIIDFNKKWVLIQKEYDFIFDGFLLVKREFITAIKHGSTQKFHKRLFQIEGKMSEVDFEKVTSLDEGGVFDLESFLLDLGREKVVILEDEREDLFLIGFVESLGKDGDFEIRFFDGVGTLDDELSVVSEEELTIVAFDSSYCLHYERYFKRKRKRS
ncbi:MAG: hypothetical protein ACSHX6_01405 [Akkermansiaceae bacterium]